MEQEYRPASFASGSAEGSASGNRRRRILEAAIHAFATGGFEGASTREIAEAAGVTDPLLFYHFKSKADLYYAAVQDQLEKLRAGLDRALVGIDDPLARLRVFVEVYLRYFVELEPGLTVTLRELNGLPPATAAAIAATHHRIVTQRLEEILEDGVRRGVFRPVSIPASGLAIIGIVQMFIRSAARHPDRFTHTDVVDQVLGVYAIGLMAPPTAP
jgi:AcrR family transcriptional regulator